VRRTTMKVVYNGRSPLTPGVFTLQFFDYLPKNSSIAFSAKGLRIFFNSSTGTPLFCEVFWSLFSSFLILSSIAEIKKTSSNFFSVFSGIFAFFLSRYRTGDIPPFTVSLYRIARIRSFVKYSKTSKKGYNYCLNEYFKEKFFAEICVGLGVL